MPGPASSVGKCSLCNFLASTGSRSIHAHARIFFKHDKINSHLMLDFESLKYVALSTCNLLKKRKAVVKQETPTD